MCASVCKLAQKRHRNAYVCFAKLMQCIRIYTPHEGSHSCFDFKMMKRQIPLTIEEAESWYCSLLVLASLPEKREGFMARFVSKGERQIWLWGNHLLR